MHIFFNHGINPKYPRTSIMICVSSYNVELNPT